MGTKLFGRVVFTGAKTSLVSPGPVTPVVGVVEFETRMHDDQESQIVKSIVHNTLGESLVGKPRAIVEALMEAPKAKYPHREIRVDFGMVRMEYQPVKGEVETGGG